MRAKMNNLQASRVNLLTDEFYDPENYLFFTEWHPISCVLCAYYDGESAIFPSFDLLVEHLDCDHKSEDPETVILAQEGVWKVILAHKQAWEAKHGRFSN